MGGFFGLVFKQINIVYLIMGICDFQLILVDNMIEQEDIFKEVELFILVFYSFCDFKFEFFYIFGWID